MKMECVRGRVCLHPVQSCDLLNCRRERCDNINHEVVMWGTRGALLQCPVRGKCPVPITASELDKGKWTRREQGRAPLRVIEDRRQDVHVLKVLLRYHRPSQLNRRTSQLSVVREPTELAVKLALSCSDGMSVLILLRDCNKSGMVLVLLSHARLAHLWV